MTNFCHNCIYSWQAVLILVCVIIEVFKLEKEIVNLTSFLLAYKPLTKQEVKQLVEEIAQQPKIVEEQATSRTVTLPRVTDRPQQTTATPGAPLVEDQIREYRQNQRARFVRERKAKKVVQKFRRRQPTSDTLEQQIAPVRYVQFLILNSQSSR